MKSKSLIALFSLLLAVSAQAKLKVFILAGQSNMQGAGQVNINPKSHTKGKGSLEYLMKDPKTAAKFAHLKNKKGAWVTRKDVRIRYDDRQDGLRPGFGARNTTIGPELGFGTIVGDAIKEPVLLIKTCWGGKSIMVDFRPPSSGMPPKIMMEKMLKHYLRIQISQCIKPRNLGAMLTVCMNLQCMTKS